MTDSFKNFAKVLAIWVTALLVCLLLCMALGGCSRKVYVPVEKRESHTDTLYQERVRVDSVHSIERIYERGTRYDSIAPILDSLDRVIGWDRYHFREVTKMNDREVNRLQSLVDSLRALRVDSIDRPVPYPVERELSRREKIKMDFGGLGFVLLGVAAAGASVLLGFRFITVKNRGVGKD